MPLTTIATAIDAFLKIPAVAQLYEDSDLPHVENILVSTAGTLKQGGVGYRIYAAAKAYLGTHPELRFVEVHDGTKIGNIDALLKSFDTLQAQEDNNLFTRTTFRVTPFVTTSVRKFAEP